MSPARNVPGSSSAMALLATNTFCSCGFTNVTEKTGSCTSSVNSTRALKLHCTPCEKVELRAPCSSSIQASTTRASPVPPRREPSPSGPPSSRRKFSSRYWSATSRGRPIETTSPFSISTARWQNRSTAAMSWVTSTIVLPSSRRLKKTSKHFCWKAASPTARISSISSTSASTWIITANASRTFIPDE